MWAPSMWAVSDLGTFLLMHRFYDLWPRRQPDGVEALRLAQIWLRDTSNAEKRAYFEQACTRSESGCGGLARVARHVCQHFDRAPHLV